VASLVLACVLTVVGGFCGAVLSNKLGRPFGGSGGGMGLDFDHFALALAGCGLLAGLVLGAFVPRLLLGRAHASDDRPAGYL
jgi:hypothetical protein